MVNCSTILVAGGSGFIGSNLIKELISEGYKVISISKNRPKIKKKFKNVTYIFQNLNKPIKKDLFIDQIDYIVNCSGYVDHRDITKGGKTVFDNHFESIYSLVNLALDLKVKALINIGSSDEYGENKSPLKETIRESPLSPYALGKLTATHYLQKCSKLGFLNTVTLRPFLVFGEMQTKDRFLPYLIDNCLNNREFKVTKGEQLRDYLYIKDFNSAVIKTIGNHEAYGEVINVASGIPISIKEVIINVQKIIGKGKPIFGGIKYRNGESMELYADIEKAKKVLTWEPQYKFEESIKNVINWYVKNE